MNEAEERNADREEPMGAGKAGESTAEACDTIADPVRRTLCKVCGLPVMGEAPFCKDHEPPVP